jgi:hypothetical protein
MSKRRDKHLPTRIAYAYAMPAAAVSMSEESVQQLNQRSLPHLFLQSAQKLSLVSSLRRPKNLSFGLIYGFKLISTFPFSLCPRTTG